MKSIIVAALAVASAAILSPASALPSAKGVASDGLVSQAETRRRPVCRTGYVRRWVRGRWRVTPHRRCL